MKKLSGMFSVSTRDFVRSCILAAIVPPLQEIARMLLTGATPHFDDYKRLGAIAIGTFVTSIVMKFTANNKKIAIEYVERKEEKENIIVNP